MHEASRVAKLLGGAKILKHRIETQRDLVTLVRTGIPVASLEALTRELDLSVDATADYLGLARRTIARRKQEDELLDPQQSERVVRVANVLALAKDVLGTIEKARTWLLKNNRGLGGAKPISLLDTDVGADEVRDVLMRVAYGVYG